MSSILTLLVAMSSVQFGASLAKQLFPIIGVQTTTMFRLVFAAAVMCAIFRPWRRELSRKELRAVVLYGTSLGVMNLLFYMSLQKLPLGVAVALEFTGPLGVAIFASRRRLDLLWAVIAACGIALILPMTETSAPIDLVGVAYALGAGLCWALYIIFGQRAGTSLHGGIASSLGMAVAAAVALPVGLIYTDPARLSWAVVPFMFGMAMLSSAIPYTLEMIVLKKLPARTFGILMSLEPALAAGSGFLFLGEALASTQWIAIFLVILASTSSSATLAKKA